jgi:hypothetical protein
MADAKQKLTLHVFIEWARPTAVSQDLVERLRGALEGEAENLLVIEEANAEGGRPGLGDVTVSSAASARRPLPTF